VGKEFDQSELFLLFLARATLSGKVTHDEGNELSRLYLDIVVHQSGISQFDELNPAHRAVDRHAIGLMQKKLIEMHPELKVELDQFLGENQGRN
jgi:hypothetical protein